MAFMREPVYILMQDDLVVIRGKGLEMFTCDQQTFDDIVMMRYYNMTSEERTKAVGRVIRNQFETGADGIRKASGLPTVQERVVAAGRRRRSTN